MALIIVSPDGICLIGETTFLHIFSERVFNMSGLTNLNLIKEIAKETKGKLGEQVTGMYLSSFFFVTHF